MRKEAPKKDGGFRLTSLNALGTTAERRVVWMSPKTFLKAKRFCILSKKFCRLGLLPSSQYFFESPRNLRRCNVAPSKTSAKVNAHPQSQSSHFCPREWSHNNYVALEDINQMLQLILTSLAFDGDQLNCLLVIDLWQLSDSIFHEFYHSFSHLGKGGGGSQAWLWDIFCCLKSTQLQSDYFDSWVRKCHKRSSLSLVI